MDDSHCLGCWVCGPCKLCLFMEEYYSRVTSETSGLALSPLGTLDIVRKDEPQV